MDEPENLSDAELLYLLRLDYVQAIRAEDYYRIQDTIIPRFRKRFSKYYNEYEKSWKDLSASRMPIHVIINPKDRQQAELGWIELVLTGQIDLPFL